LLLGDWLRISHQVVRKMVLYRVCFADSLLLLLVVVVVVFPLLLYYTVFISTHEFPLFSISLHHPAGGEGEGCASGCLVLSCQLLG